MKQKILSSPYSMPSAMILRESIRALTGIKFLVTSNPGKVEEPLLRYGNSNGLFAEDTLNTPEFIRLCSYKNNFSKILLENGIYTPRYHRNDHPEEFPVLIRETLTASGGKGIILCKDKQEFDANWKPLYWWTKYVRTEFELRVHVLGGKISRVFKKEMENEDVEFPIRNNANCHFSLRVLENYTKLVNLVNELSKCINPNSFYALDIGWDKREKKYFIFEANSAPGLNSQTAEEYAKFLVERLEIKGEVNE